MKKISTLGLLVFSLALIHPSHAKCREIMQGNTPNFLGALDLPKNNKETKAFDTTKMGETRLDPQKHSFIEEIIAYLKRFFKGVPKSVTPLQPNLTKESKPETSSDMANSDVQRLQTLNEQLKKDCTEAFINLNPEILETKSTSGTFSKEQVKRALSQIPGVNFLGEKMYPLVATYRLSPKENEKLSAQVYMIPQENPFMKDDDGKEYLVDCWGNSLDLEKTLGLGRSADFADQENFNYMNLIFTFAERAKEDHGAQKILLLQNSAKPLFMFLNTANPVGKLYLTYSSFGENHQQTSFKQFLKDVLMSGMKTAQQHQEPEGAIGFLWFKGSGNAPSESGILSFIPGSLPSKPVAK